jgi:hypothetical protein
MTLARARTIPWVLVAVALLILVSAVAAKTVQPESAVDAGSARDRAADEVIAGNGSPCIARSNVMFAAPGDEVDAAIRDRGGPGRWIEPALQYAGSKEQARQAYGGRWIEGQNGEIWIIQSIDGRSRAREIRHLVTPAGVDLWVAADMTVSAPCEQ